MAWWGAIVSTSLASPVHAAEGGYSNYIPGFYGEVAIASEPPTALSIRNDTYHYAADGGRASRAGVLELDADLSLLFNYPSLIHKPGIELFGAQYAYGAVLAFGRADIDSTVRLGALQRDIRDDAAGLADLTLIPGMLFWNRDPFHLMVAHYVVAPLASYDKDDLGNIGLNYWTFEVDLASTSTPGEWRSTRVRARHTPRPPRTWSREAAAEA